jgi:hypothetical protein
MDIKMSKWYRFKSFIRWNILGIIGILMFVVPVIILAWYGGFLFELGVIVAIGIWVIVASVLVAIGWD